MSVVQRGRICVPFDSGLVDNGIYIVCSDPGTDVRSSDVKDFSSKLKRRKLSEPSSWEDRYDVARRLSLFGHKVAYLTMHAPRGPWLTFLI